MFCKCSFRALWNQIDMPAKRPSANPWRNPMLQHLAADGRLVMLRCKHCRRSVYFWAADLVKVLGPHHPADRPPWPCSICGQIEFVEISAMHPTGRMLSEITIRRPVHQVTRWIWRNEVGGG